jgi:DNA-binding NtrC family response regulator
MEWRNAMVTKTPMEHENKFKIGRTRILLVDEEPGDLRILRLVLEGHGLDVTTCTTYEAGVRNLETRRFDFIVVSQGSRAFEGRQVLDRVAQLDCHLPVLVVTRCLDMPRYLEAMQMGAIDYMEKPVPAAELLRFVRTHGQRERVTLQGNAA